MNFVKKMEETYLDSEYNESVTENGAVGYKSTGKALLDLNFSVSSMRNMDEDEIVDRFLKAYNENKKLAIKWLFYARDVRGGMGERRLFRICIKKVYELDRDIFLNQFLLLVPEYGRWDDLISLIDLDAEDDALNKVIFVTLMKQLDEDILNMQEGKPISLLAKWMPSIKTSSDKSMRLAKYFCKLFKISNKKYRQVLSSLRKYLKVVEIDMSHNDWDKIDYAIVPSRANLIYKDAFVKHDTDRRLKYLESLKKGETKINGSVNFPHDIVVKYKDSYSLDDTLEQLWKALPDYVQGNGSTLCVLDGSGSMRYNKINACTSCEDVARGMTLYFSERCSGQFKDTFITFSMRPQLVHIDPKNSLHAKLEILARYTEYANTNIEAVFNLILKTAKDNNMKQEDIPANILILSDMEFDECSRTNDGDYELPNKNLFKHISDKYEAAGYKLPRLVFWNIYSRTGTIPVKENELGVSLVSGFSPAVCKMVLDSELDPYKNLLNQLNDLRYKPIEDYLVRMVELGRL